MSNSASSEHAAEDSGAEAARRQEESLRAHLAAVVESSDDAIISKTLDGTITTWNKGAERIFGYTPAEAIGRPITMLMAPDRVGEEVAIVARIRAGQRVEHFETMRIRKDGTPLLISLSISPIRDRTGTIIGASKIARDITARKRMEDALRDETRVLELLNKSGSVIASQLDLHELVQSVTDAATQMSGAQIGALFYNTQIEGNDSLTLQALSGASRSTFQSNCLTRDMPILKPTFHGRSMVRCDDITQHPLFDKTLERGGTPLGDPTVRSYLAVPIITRAGEVIGGLFFGHSKAGVFTERTERIIFGVAAQAAIAIDNARLYEDVKRAAAERERLLEAERLARGEAERANVMKDEFLATLSHELRTPLNAILGWAQILQPFAEKDETLKEGLAVIERNTRVQAQLIDDLLDMSRIVSGKLRLDVQDVNVHDVMKAAIGSLQLSADAKDLHLAVNVVSPGPTVRGDPARLQQCFWNLISNAVKFTPRGGEIQINLRESEQHVEISVIDNGQGIGPEFLPHLFERFRQADSSTTRRHGGLGLGLSIIKHLVEMHGGSVSAHSGGAGKGATFRIELPLPAHHLAMSPNPSKWRGSAAMSERPSLEGIIVLAVDDEPDARRILKRVLEHFGAKVILAACAREALENLSSVRPHVIISDIGMPEEDGYAFIRKVRALSPGEGGDIPAAALTAFARAEDRARALRAGYQMHVAKPVEAGELAGIVASLALQA